MSQNTQQLRAARGPYDPNAFAIIKFGMLFLSIFFFISPWLALIYPDLFSIYVYITVYRFSVFSCDCLPVQQGVRWRRDVMNNNAESELATTTAMQKKQNFEKKKRAWRSNLMQLSPKNKRNLSPKNKRNLDAIADMRDTSNLATQKTKRRSSLSLPLGIVKNRNGPLTGRRPSRKKSNKLTPYGNNEMGDAQGLAKKYRKSSYWKQKVYNINYSRMRNTRSCVQV